MTRRPAIETKSALRARLLAARRAAGDDVRDAEARALANALENALEHLVSPGSTVCAYVPVGAEPGGLDLLDVLLRRGARVLLPVVRTGDDGTPEPLAWGEYRSGQLVTARFGLLEPAPPLLPPAALADADLVVVPALAVDRRGGRLGRGAGYYDRSLALRAPRARLVAVVRDAELVDELPVEPHDVPMTHALTPGRGLVPLECPGPNGGSST
ncbi:5-formyltetrahydrofolate cyclo-ligase [Mycobacterium sp. M1]|uniref:5-formyltetrahydrofolate cyclo-ligase n=1 Tax=Mycolicibacter acidiphilus TaxID=2835306 RepID=A0ABS5RK26_9MYCO|nr:5-formyltetrahydrofolate cyclo-ligase [Mycolicibacter acidiphilus]MBS9534646.1 5-formyltetrahydrofolate cyclo-ligase [Mycolicibacter acidiphilus]